MMNPQQTNKEYKLMLSYLSLLDSLALGFYSDAEFFSKWSGKQISTSNWSVEVISEGGGGVGVSNNDLSSSFVQ